MKQQRHHRLPVNYRLSNELAKSKTFEPMPWRRKGKKGQDEETQKQPSFGPRRSRKPVTLAKP